MARISKEQAARIWCLAEYHRQQRKRLSVHRLLQLLHLPLSHACAIEDLSCLGFFGPVYMGPSNTVDELRRRARSTACYATHRAFFEHRGVYHCIKERFAAHPIPKHCFVQD